VGPGRFNEYSRSHSREGGLRAFEESREVHCLYLELAAENGILGLGVFAVMMTISLRTLLLARRRFQDVGDRPMSFLVTGFFLALVAYLASALFLHLSYARYFWLMLALADVAALQAFLVRPEKGEQ
jgi:O-antigen ligase